MWWQIWSIIYFIYQIRLIKCSSVFFLCFLKCDTFNMTCSRFDTKYQWIFCQPNERICRGLILECQCLRLSHLYLNLEYEDLLALQVELNSFFNLQSTKHKIQNQYFRKLKITLLSEQRKMCECGSACQYILSFIRLSIEDCATHPFHSNLMVIRDVSLPLPHHTSSSHDTDIRFYFCCDCIFIWNMNKVFPPILHDSFCSIFILHAKSILAIHRSCLQCFMCIFGVVMIYVQRFPHKWHVSAYEKQLICRYEALINSHFHYTVRASSSIRLVVQAAA